MSDEWTTDPRALRRRAREQEKLEEKAAEIEKELRDFFKNARNDLAKEFHSGMQSPPSSDPFLDKVLRNPEGVGYGGPVDSSDD